MTIVLLNVDTSFRNKTTYPNAANYTHTLSSTISNVTSLELTSIELTNIRYQTFNSLLGNTSFNVIFNSVTYTITIPGGIYAIVDIIIAIQGQLDQLRNILRLQITYDTIALTTIITELTGQIFSLDFTNPLGYNAYTLGYRLGYRSNTYSSSSQYIAEGGAIMFYGNYIYFNINNYGTVYNDIMSSSCIAKITTQPGLSADYSTLSNIYTTVYTFSVPTNISTLNIQLFDWLGNQGQLPYDDYSFTLQLTTT